MKKKILICGATGFIGRNILEDFSRNDGVEEIEAFEHSVVVFGHMKYAKNKGVYFDKSAPVTVGDFFVRLDELRRVNKVTPDLKMMKKHQLQML